MSIAKLGFGAMELRRPEVFGTAEEVLNAALDCGIGFIDTSPDYGASEELIGKYISHRRSEYRLATKCGCDLANGGHVFTGGHIINNLSDSLRKLKTDYIDIWQLHCVTPPDLPGKADTEAVRVMADMKAAGKVRNIGVSFKNGNPSDTFYPTGHQEDYALEMAEWGCFDTFQMVYGALMRVSGETIKAMKGLGTYIIARGALKRYYPYFDEIIRAAKLFELYEHGETESGFLIRFALANCDVDMVIVGSANPEHIRANAAAARRGALSDDVYAEAVRRLMVGMG
jgi:aryl-alcohol dehydrogenase-like predicted oxidoreductase